jgi:hypothetical protein
LLEEAGLAEGQDLKHIEGQVKAARSLLEEHESKNCVKRPSARKYKKETGGGDLKNDLSVYKASQNFRQHLLQIADLPAEQKDSALDALVKSFAKLEPVKLIALYRLNKSFA